ncbi:hypothetical protein ANCDUO_14441, partial [Ancylostoma duodenale]
MRVSSSSIVRVPISTVFLCLLLRTAYGIGGVASRKCSRNSINLGQLIDTLLTDYDVHLLPESEGVNVTIELHVQEISRTVKILKILPLDYENDPMFVIVDCLAILQGVSGISEITGDFSLDVMYSEIWQDPRLAFKHLNVCATNITLKSDFRKKIWTPDTCIINSKSSSIHSSPSEN